MGSVFLFVLYMAVYAIGIFFILMIVVDAIGGHVFSKLERVVVLTIVGFVSAYFAYHGVRNPSDSDPGPYSGMCRPTQYGEQCY